MRFIHYASTHLEAIEDRGQPRRPRGDKPDGLWFSAGDGEDGWRAWCEAESFALGSLTHATEIVFHAKAKLLRLKTASALDAFAAEYGCIPDWAVTMRSAYFNTGHAIKWPLVAERYDGIVIAPYIYSRRLHEGTHFYYSWDCASGCVWRARAVKALRPLLTAGASHQ